MGLSVVDITLENLRHAPPEVLVAVFWELDTDEVDVDPGFEKEEWFSSTLLEWGVCGKLAVQHGESLGFAEFAPPALFPRLARFPSGRVSPDAVYLSYCYIAPEHRGRGLGKLLIRAVAGDLLDRGYGGLEAIGDREWGEGWVLPSRFLESNGFRVLREDPRYPLLRLDLGAVAMPEPGRAEAQVAEPVPEEIVSIPAPGAA